MNLLKRIWLFILTNIAIVAMITIFFTILWNVFWINFDIYWFNYILIAIYSAIIWFSWAFISLFISKWIAKKSYNIQIINLENVSDLDPKLKTVWETVEEISARENIKMPEVWYYESSEPNAFATWASKNNSLVAVSTWLLDVMDKDAIEWVIGHEMAHVTNWDMVTMTLLQWILNTFVIFFAKIVANIIDSALSWDEERSWPSFTYYIIDIALQMVFGLIASIIVMWFSRYREYKADAWSAFFVWKDKMIDWLKTLQKLEPVLIKTNDSDPNAAFKIESKPRWGIMKLFASHPPLEDRIKALEELRI